MNESPLSEISPHPRHTNSSPFPSSSQPPLNTHSLLCHVRSFTLKFSSLLLSFCGLAWLSKLICIICSCLYASSNARLQTLKRRDRKTFFPCFVQRQWFDSRGIKLESHGREEKGMAGISKWSRFTYLAHFSFSPLDVLKSTSLRDRQSFSFQHLRKLNRKKQVPITHLPLFCEAGQLQ